LLKKEAWMTDEVEVQEEQAPEAEAATDTVTDEIGDQPAAESTEMAEDTEASQDESAESDQGEDSTDEESAGEESEAL
jgi:hypothetical protein